MSQRLRSICPNCQRRVKFAPENLGRRLRCNHCGHVFRTRAEDLLPLELPPRPSAPDWGVPVESSDDLSRLDDLMQSNAPGRVDAKRMRSLEDELQRIRAEVASQSAQLVAAIQQIRDLGGTLTPPQDPAEAAQSRRGGAPTAPDEFATMKTHLSSSREQGPEVEQLSAKLRASQEEAARLRTLLQGSATQEQDTARDDLDLLQQVVRDLRAEIAARTGDAERLAAELETVRADRERHEVRASDLGRVEAVLLARVAELEQSRDQESSRRREAERRLGAEQARIAEERRQHEAARREDVDHRRSLTEAEAARAALEELNAILRGDVEAAQRDAEAAARRDAERVAAARAEVEKIRIEAEAARTVGDRRIAALLDERDAAQRASDEVISTLRGQLEAARVELEADRDQRIATLINEREADHRVHNEQIAALKAQLETARVEIEADRDRRIATLLDEREADRRALNDEIANLKGQLEAARNEVEAARGELEADRDQRIATLINEHEASRRAFEEEIAALRGQLEAACTERDEPRTLRAEADRLRQDAEQARHAHADEVAALGVQLEAVCGEAETLRNRLDTERRAAEATRSETEAAQAQRIAALVAEAEESARQTQRAAASEAEAERLRGEAEAARWETEERIAVLTAEVEAARQEAVAAREELEGRLARHREAERDRRTLEGEVERLRREAKAIQAKRDDRLAALRAELEAARADREGTSRADDELEQLRRAADEATRQHDERLAAMQVQLDEARSEAERAHQETADEAAHQRNEQVAAIQAQLDEARAEAERVRQEAEAARNEWGDIVALRVESERVRQELEETRRQEAEEHQAEIARLRDELDRARSEARPDPAQAPQPPVAPAQTATYRMPKPAADGAHTTNGSLSRIESVSRGPPRPQAFSTGHFRRIAANGFGDGRNSYAWSCAYFQNHLYIGTIRNMLVSLNKRVPFDTVWPVPLPKSEDELDLCAQIWRYDFDADSWQRVFRSPMVEGLKGKQTPLATGFRNMSVFQGKSDTQPAIYSIPSCNRFHGQGPILLRSEDGLDWVPASEPGLGLGDPNVIAFRGNVPFKGRLFIAPSGSRGGNCNTSYNAVVLCTDDPARGGWTVCNPPSFGDPNNHGIFDIGVCGGYLYAGTINIRGGFQLWKTDGEGPLPFRWTKVLDCGADRGPHNQAIICLTEFRGNLYLGTGIQNGGFDRINNIGPDAGEVIRVYPDDTWDLVMGQPRITRQGVKVPSSGLGPGFDNPLAGYIWRMRAHEGGLYVGTYDMSSTLPFTGVGQWPEWLQRLITREDLDRYMEFRGGCELWRTTDGDHWVAVTRNGFGNPYNWGIRSLLSTPRGLIVGTANPFGPQVAVRGPAGWRYEENPKGGLEIWHGSYDHDDGADPPGQSAGQISFDASIDDGTMPAGPLIAAMGDLAGDPDRDDSIDARQILDSLADQALSNADIERHGRHDIGAFEARRDVPWNAGPIRKLASARKDLVGLSADVEAEVAEYFGGSELRNVGYWRDNPSWTPGQASEQLIEELLLLAPSEAPPPASILVGGAGVVALTERLRKRFPDASVTAMPPLSEAGTVTLRAADASCDRVIWVEGPGFAALGETAREIVRVLRPGGLLLATDLVGTLADRAALPFRAGGIDTLLAEYRGHLERAGLADVKVLNATRETWGRFSRHSTDFFATKLSFLQLDEELHHKVIEALPGGGLIVEAYVFASAAKPMPA